MIAYVSTGVKVLLVLMILATAPTTGLASDGDVWNPIDTPPKVEAGSALDLSFLNHTPAGKHGFVLVDSRGNYYFQDLPNEPVRFYGPNVVSCAAIDLNRDQAERMADRLASMGYNVVRFHYMDAIESWIQGIFKYPVSTEVAPLPQKLDNLEYFIAELKKRGIYVTLDIMSYIPLRGIPGLWDYTANCGYLAVLFQEGMETWKSMARVLLSHVNPYTGLALKDDPVLVGVCPWNEDILYNMNISSPGLREWLRQDFNEFLKAKGKAPVETLTASIWNEPGAVRSSLMEYYADKTLAAYSEMKEFLKDELGVRAPIGGLNFINCAYVNMMRTYADVHETHQYNGLLSAGTGSTIRFYPGRHPRFSMVFDPESKDNFVSQYSSTVFTQYIPSLALTQLYQKPFILSEYTQEFPTKGREDVGLIVAAVGGFNGWDMLNRFNWGAFPSQTVDGTILGGTGGGASFTVANDTLAIYSEIQGALAFRKSQLAESEPRFVIVRNKDYAKTHESALYNNSEEGYLTYLVHLFKTVVVYVDKPLSQLQVIYKITPELSAEDIAAGNIPDANMIHVNKNMTLEEAARVFIGSLVDDDLREQLLRELDNRRLVSDTGQLIFDLDLNTYFMTTPYMVGVVGTLDGSSFDLGNATLKADIDKGTMTATALDDKPLDESGRILVTYTTDVRAMFDSYSQDRENSQMTVYLRGMLPTQIKYGTGEFSLVPKADPQSYKAYKLDMNGRRVQAIPVNVDGQTLTISLETDSGFAFELTTEPEN